MSSRTIVDSVARTLWVTAWADWMEEQGERLHGELFNQAPKTPRQAQDAARKLVKKVESMNKMKIDDLYEAAANAEGHHSRMPDEEDFGYSIAMSSLGHGVSWEDDHPDIGIKYPNVEFMYEGEDVFWFSAGSKVKRVDIRFKTANDDDIQQAIDQFRAAIKEIEGDIVRAKRELSKGEIGMHASHLAHSLAGGQYTSRKDWYWFLFK
jgi:hypothetical protein